MTVYPLTEYSINLFTTATNQITRKLPLVDVKNPDYYFKNLQYYIKNPHYKTIIM